MNYILIVILKYDWNFKLRSVLQMRSLVVHRSSANDDFSAEIIDH